MRSKSKITLTAIARGLFYIYICTLFVFSFREESVQYSEYVFFAFAAIAILHCLIKKTLKYNMIIICLSVFAMLSLLSTIWAIKPSTAMTSGISLCTLIVMLILVFQVFEMNNLDTLIYVIFFAGCIMVAMTIQDMGVAGYFEAMFEGKRIAGTMVAANTYGVYSSISFLCGLHTLKGKRYKLVHLFLLAIVLSGILSSNSRNAFILCMVGVLLYLLYGNPGIQLSKRIKYILLGIVAILVLYNLGLFEGILKRLESVDFTDGNDVSVNTRLLMVRVGWKIFYDKPLLGCGINNAQYVLESFFAKTYLHNNYMELLADVGLVGFSAYYATHLIGIRKLFLRHKKDVNERLFPFLIILIILLMMADMSIVFYYNKITYVLFGAIAVALKNKTK